MRKYQHIWTQLKRDEYLEITAPSDLHNTVMRALRKESLKDTVFRFKCVEASRSYSIRFNSVQDLLFIRLEFINSIPKKFVNHKRY